jgi:hypothetical protein
VEENVKMAKPETEGKIIEQVSDLSYLGYLVPNGDNYTSLKMNRYNKMNGII